MLGDSVKLKQSAWYRQQQKKMLKKDVPFFGKKIYAGIHIC